MHLEGHIESLNQNRYKAATQILVALKTTTDLRWAPPAEFKKAFDAQLLQILGPKDERDVHPKKPLKLAAKSGAKSQSTHSEDRDVAKDNMFVSGFLANLHKPRSNEQLKPELMEQHLKATGGKVFTRFPPEVSLTKVSAKRDK